MKPLLSRLFLAGGQNAVPFSGWFLAGWSPGTTLALFWFENLVLTVFIAARVAAHWQATRTRGHEKGFLRNFLLTSLTFTIAHGVFLSFVLFGLLEDSVNRQELVTGVQWMLCVQVASLLLDLWRIGRWPFAEIRVRTDWMLGRIVGVHLSILFGMFLFASMGQPWWFFSFFVGFKGLMDVGSMLGHWQYKPKTAPKWLERAANSIGPASGKNGETFAEYWARTTAVEDAKHARDEEVVDA